MENILEVTPPSTSTTSSSAPGIIDESGLTVELINGNNGGGLLTNSASVIDDNSSYTFIINLPSTLSFSGSGDDGGGCGGDDYRKTVGVGGDLVSDSSHQLTGLQYVPTEENDVVEEFTELTNLDNGIVTKVDSDNTNTNPTNELASSVNGESELTEVLETRNGLSLGSASSIGSSVVSVTTTKPVVFGDPSGLSLDVGGVGGEGQNIYVNSELLKRIHQGLIQEPEKMNEVVRKKKDEEEEKGGQAHKNVKIKMEQVRKAQGAKIQENFVSSTIKKEISVDHCNNDPKPLPTRCPVRTYSKKSKLVSISMPMTMPTFSTPISTPSTSITEDGPSDAARLINTSIQLLPVQKISIKRECAKVTKPTAVTTAPPVVLSKKRKLIIDSHKQINNLEFKKQLKETGDIVHEPKADLAPSTKTAMKCMEYGGVAQFFTSPGRTIINGPLAKLYYNNLLLDVELEASSASSKRKNVPKMSKIPPLNSNLEVSDEDGNSSTSDINKVKEVKEDKQLPRTTKVSALSVESELRRMFSKPLVFKEYASVRWKRSSNRSLSKSLLKLKQERRESQRTTTSTSDQSVSSLATIKTEVSKDASGNDDLPKSINESSSNHVAQPEDNCDLNQISTPANTAINEVVAVEQSPDLNSVNEPQVKCEVKIENETEIVGFQEGNEFVESESQLPSDQDSLIQEESITPDRPVVASAEFIL